MKARREREKKRDQSFADALSPSPETEVREETVAIPVSEFEGIQARCRESAEYKDKYLRVLAEGENIRKRLEKERREYIDFANQDLINDLIQVLDNFERALSSETDDSRDDPYRQGIEMIYKQFKEVLRKQGLEEVKALGEKFNPFLHEAVEQEITSEHPDEVILRELLKGYTLKGRLLRPSAVKVSRRPPSQEIGEEE